MCVIDYELCSVFWKKIYTSMTSRSSHRICIWCNKKGSHCKQIICLSSDNILSDLAQAFPSATFVPDILFDQRFFRKKREQFASYSRESSRRRRESLSKRNWVFLDVKSCKKYMWNPTSVTRCHLKSRRVTSSRDKREKASESASWRFRSAIECF